MLLLTEKKRLFTERAFDWSRWPIVLRTRDFIWKIVGSEQKWTARLKDSALMPIERVPISFHSLSYFARQPFLCIILSMRQRAIEQSMVYLLNSCWLLPFLFCLCAARTQYEYLFIYLCYSSRISMAGNGYAFVRRVEKVKVILKLRIYFLLVLLDAVLFEWSIQSWCWVRRDPHMICRSSYECQSDRRKQIKSEIRMHTSYDSNIDSLGLNFNNRHSDWTTLSMRIYVSELTPFVRRLEFVWLRQSLNFFDSTPFQEAEERASRQGKRALCRTILMSARKYEYI